MARMSGIETVRQLRQRRPALRVLFITGYAETSVLGTQTGSDPVLKKPFNREALAAAVTGALRRPAAPPTARLVPLRS